MKLKSFLTFFALSLSLTLSAKLEEQTLTYKTVGERKLNMVKITSEKTTKKSAAILFFFGGGWNNGKIDQLRPQAEILAELGMTCFLVDYRVKSRDKVMPDKCIEDAKSAMRYVRENAKSLGVNPKKIAASGASAGGHLAAAAAYIDEFNDAGDNMKISCVPDALVLFNPVCDSSPRAYSTASVKAVGWERMSALHHIKKSSPPAIFMVGDKDKFVPVVSATEFKERVEATGAYCELLIYEGCEHTFFNTYRHDGKYFKLTMEEVIKFLTKIKFIK